MKKPSLYELENCLDIDENQISDPDDQMKETSPNIEKKIFGREITVTRDMKEQQSKSR